MTAFLKYRVNLTPTVPTSNTVKGSPLTSLEIDANFKSIANDLTLIRTGDGSSGTWAISISGQAATVATNANLTGEATSSGNVVTLTNDSVIAKTLSGYTSGVGTVTLADSILSAIQKIDANSSNATVIGRLLTGYTAGAGTVAATDSILSAIQKVDGNSSNATVIARVLTGYTAGAGTVSAADSIRTAIQKVDGNSSNATVITRTLTGYSAGTGTVSAADSILTAIQKLGGNGATYATIAAPTFTGIPAAPTAAADVNTTQLATTAYVIGQAASVAPLALATAAVVGTSLRYARQDHVHSGVNPYFRAHQLTSTISIATPGTLQTVLFNTVSFGSAYAVGTGKYTAPAIGIYSLDARVQITGTALTSATIQITKNGTATIVASETVTLGSTGSVDLTIHDLVQATAITDTFEIRVTASGTTPVVAFGTSLSYFSAALVSR